jgi:hypothetical protein
VSTASCSTIERGEIGPDLFRQACLMGLEGMVSKRTDSRYRAGRSLDWVKVKNRSRQRCRGPRMHSHEAEHRSGRPYLRRRPHPPVKSRFNYFEYGHRISGWGNSCTRGEPASAADTVRCRGRIIRGKLGAAGAKTIADTRGAARSNPLRHYSRCCGLPIACCS